MSHRKHPVRPVPFNKVSSFHLPSSEGDRPYLCGGASLGDVYGLAHVLLENLPGKDQGEGSVLLLTQDKMLIAASLLAGLAGSSDILIPHAVSEKVLPDIQSTRDLKAILTDLPIKPPKGVQVIRPPDAGHEINPPAPVRGPDEPFVYLFTGGSTGKPVTWSKTPANLFGEAGYQIDIFGVSEDDVLIPTVPPQHIYGLLFTVLLPLLSGARVLDDVAVFPQEIASAVEREGGTVLLGAPAHYKALRDTDFQGGTLRLALSSGGPLDAKDGQNFSERTGVPLVEVYGSTETGGIATRCRFFGETALTPFKAVDWKVRKERLHVSSPFLSPEIPRDKSGYCLTGDRTKAVSENAFALLGRVDGIVKVGGKRVDLGEVEDRIRTITGVSDAYVFSMETVSARQNEIVAVVEGTVSEQEIRDSLSTQLEPHAIPRRLRMVEEIPLTPAGKRDREAVLELFNQ